MTSTADQQIDDLINRHEASWRLGYDAFPSVLNKLSLSRGAEIGVAFGGHSEAILQNTGVTKLYAVDSYKHRPEYDDPMNLPQPVFDRLYERTGQRLSAFGDRIQQIRLDSVRAAEQINEQLDFVYIDGDHSYEGIRADLEAWFPLIREGGIIAGHDYGQPAFPGVKAAADQFFKRFGLTVKHEGKGIWWAHRPATELTVVIPVDGVHFCDATLHQRLISAGLTERDTILLVHDEQHTADAAYRVLQAHPHVEVQKVRQLRGSWQAVMDVIDQIETPLVLPLDLNASLGPGVLATLRERVCDSGAVACRFAPGPSSNDFTLTDLLATPQTREPMMVMTSVIQHAQVSLSKTIASASATLVPWLILLDALGQGGRLALQTGDIDEEPSTYGQADCRLAAQALTLYADLIDGTDLLRLKWPGNSNQWLNQLDRKPIRTRAYFRPVDVPPADITPRFMDRVVHTVRRTLRRAA
jgi:hypothetical protein